MTKDEAITILSDAVPSAGPKREALKCLMDLIDEMENDLDTDLRDERNQLRERLADIAENLADMGLLTNTPKAKFDFVWGNNG